MKRTTIADPAAERARDLALRNFRPSAPDRLWVTDMVRHEALFDRAVMEGHRRWGVAAPWFEAEGSLIFGMGVRVDSGPDNDESCQNCQMVRARLARRRGIREEPVSERPSRNPPARNLADMGWVASRTRVVGELPVRRMSSAREAMVKVCGVAMAMVQGHNWVPIPSNGQQ